MSNKPKVAFICVHNSCRSQIKRHLASIVLLMVCYSGGTETKLKLIKMQSANERAMVDETTQHSKLRNTSVDIVITMGCNVECPYLPSKHRKIGDWMILQEVMLNLKSNLNNRNKIKS